MAIAWSKQLSVGNRIIDSEHKNLLYLIANIIRLIVAAEVAASLKGFELLENCLCAYFVAEENIAQAVNFDFTQHKLEHQSLLNKFQKIKEVLMAKNNSLYEQEVKGYIDSLRYCLIQHIKEDSKPFKAVLDSHFYDLKPN